MRILNIEEKLEFIKSNYNIKTDPFLDVALVKNIRRGLIEKGFYKSSGNNITDDTIIRMILACQGKTKRNNNTKYKS